MLFTSLAPLTFSLMLSPVCRSSCFTSCTRRRTVGHRRSRHPIGDTSGARRPPGRGEHRPWDMAHLQLWPNGIRGVLQQVSHVPTCSVTSRTHFDRELACRHSQVRPVACGSGRRITFTSRCQWQRAVSLFVGPAGKSMAEKEHLERNFVAKRNHTRKIQLQPEVTMTADQQSEEKLRKLCLAVMATFEQSWKKRSLAKAIQRSRGSAPRLS